MFQGLETRMYEGARGNKLLRNAGDRFQVVSGIGRRRRCKSRRPAGRGAGSSPISTTMGILDLYVSNGYYTPPEAAATEVDL